MGRDYEGKVKPSMKKIMGENREVSVFELPAKFTKHITNVYSFALAHEKKMTF